jgi:hypothetical protein
MITTKAIESINKCRDAQALLTELADYFESIKWHEHAMRINDLATHIGIYVHQLAEKEGMK